MNNNPEWDAQTLAEAKVIEADPSRMAAAKVAAEKLAKKKEEEARAMKKVSGQRVRKPKDNDNFMGGL